jgi:hypothetical protein
VQGKTAGYIGRLVDYGLASAMWHLLVPIAFAIGCTEAMEYMFGTTVLAGFIAGAVRIPECCSVPLLCMGAVAAVQQLTMNPALIRAVACNDCAIVCVRVCVNRCIGIC